MVFSSVASTGLASISEGKFDRGWLTVTGPNPFPDVGVEPRIWRLRLNTRIVDAGCFGDSGQMEIVRASGSGPIDFETLAFIVSIAVQLETMRNPSLIAGTRKNTAAAGHPALQVGRSASQRARVLCGVMLIIRRRCGGGGLGLGKAPPRGGGGDRAGAPTARTPRGAASRQHT